MTNTNSPISYSVRYAHTSAVERFDDLDDACAAVLSVFPGAVIDYENLPECDALVWRDDAESFGDDGSRAVARISAAECLGHDTLIGAIGSTSYCNGSCRL